MLKITIPSSKALIGPCNGLIIRSFINTKQKFAESTAPSDTPLATGKAHEDLRTIPYSF